MSTVEVAAPATQETTKKPRKVKPKFPVAENKDDRLSIELDATAFTYPDGFDPKVHAPLSRKHFKEDWMYMVFKAVEAEAAAVAFRADAKETKEAGPMKAQKDKLAKLRERMNKEAAKLIEHGMDAAEVKAYMATLLGGESA